MLMAKLWEFRQWHHELILQRTQKEVGKEGLSEWAAAGSTTLTSDIDVNLKGNKTEQAVAVFNRLFKADGFEHEPGVGLRRQRLRARLHAQGHVQGPRGGARRRCRAPRLRQGQARGHAVAGARRREGGRARRLDWRRRDTHSEMLQVGWSPPTPTCSACGRWSRCGST